MMYEKRSMQSVGFQPCMKCYVIILIKWLSDQLAALKKAILIKVSK